MHVYQELLEALARRTDDQRRAAYNSLKDERVLRGSFFLYVAYVLCGFIIGFFLSQGASGVMRVGVLGVIGFITSSALFVDYIRAKRIINAIVVLVLKAEDERQYKVVDALPIVNAAAQKNGAPDSRTEAPMQTGGAGPRSDQQRRE